MASRHAIVGSSAKRLHIRAAIMAGTQSASVPACVMHALLRACHARGSSGKRVFSLCLCYDRGADCVLIFTICFFLEQTHRHGHENSSSVYIQCRWHDLRVPSGRVDDARVQRGPLLDFCTER